MADQTTNDDGGSSRATASPAGPSTDVPPLSQDALFDALASRRSRYILHNLRSEDTPVTLDTIVDTVAAWEMDKSIDLVSDEHRRNVLMSLQHTQLPKLAMAGLVQYDEERSLIDKGIHADQADAYLDIAVARDDAVPTPE
ncbi:hypothetical protein A4G99_01695 [Haladaptatus sp. R4]|uniref:DUF7344 domain-containing protein n=1 Tax=unclassified Haladaptatus TaxID=2622732 RepID=UPI0007B499ED|nr:hypothetical protein [Haladaptatus sp. R4]KZN25254.1 hypothetical protein A4G99_01695 [Haladaptatus sp. R4]